MIAEQYITFEVAKLLKEKGFDWNTKGFYSLKGSSFGEFMYWEGDGYRNSDFVKNVSVSAPTQQMTMRWLREEKNIYIEIRRSPNTFQYGAIIMKDARVICRIEKKHEIFEKAVEEALKYCLENLI